MERIPLAQLLRMGETVLAEEIEITVPDGRSVSSLVNATPRPAAGRWARSHLWSSPCRTWQDRPVHELERARTEFVRIVSHELRAPLSASKGSTTTLPDEADALDAAEIRRLL